MPIILFQDGGKMPYTALSSSKVYKKRLHTNRMNRFYVIHAQQHASHIYTCIFIFKHKFVVLGFVGHSIL